MDGNIRTIYSHPDKELKNHLSNVAELMLKLHGKKFLSFCNNYGFVIKNIGLAHDFGKYTTYFQNYLLKKQKDHRNLHFHSFISALFGGWLNKEKLNYSSLISFFVIKHHHGNLSNFSDIKNKTENLNILKEQIKNLKEQKDCIRREYELTNINIDSFFENYKDVLELIKKESFLLRECETKEQKFHLYFVILYLFSLLIYSDKTEVVIGTKLEQIELPEDVDKFIDNYKKKAFKHSEESELKLNILRNEAYNVSLENLSNQYKNGNIFSLNLPTGAGKTLTVLNLAFNLLKKDKSLQRIIYALPFTSIIDQTEKVIKDIFEENSKNPDDFLTVHHHLAEVKVKNDENYIEGDKAEFLIENWDKPLILTTFWQLFNSIITNKNSQLRKFHNLANSIIILDEVQTIPYKYWILTNEVFKKMCELFNIKIIFLTATMPLIFDEKKGEIIPLIPEKNRDEYFSKFSRYEIKVINQLNDINVDNLFEIAQNDINKNKDKSFLFVFNTIKTSIEFYKKIEREFSSNSQREIIYLSSNIIPIERKKRIEKIKNSPQNKIIVSTQVIEAGVDIDLDIVYRDFAPLDSIIQSAGRCNRNNKKETGIFKLFRLKNEKDKYDYGYIYKGLSLEATDKIFKGKEKIKENEILKLINEYYKEIRNNSSSNPSNEILDAMKNLNYEDVNNNFKLIEELPSFSMFFEINDNAKELLERFRKIMEIENRFERKSEFLKIKSKFYQYVLSVKIARDTLSYNENLSEIAGIRIVLNNFIESVYDNETGLKKEVSVFI